MIADKLNYNPGYTRLQASTNFACMGENVTFLCTTSNFILIWEVTFADRTIGSTRHPFQIGDTPGIVNSESIGGVHLHFQLVSNSNGVLNSILMVHMSASLENAVIECDGTETHSLTFRLACKCHDESTVLLSQNNLMCHIV